MDAQLVLKNLTDYDGWEHTNYKLVKAEADVIINALKKQVASEVEEIEESDTGEDGEEIYRTLQMCPACHKMYRFLVPKYCEWCGQKLKE